MSLTRLQEKMKITADGVFGQGTLSAGMRYFKLSPDRAAHFFGQISHETGNFKTYSENLNYGTEGLKSTFGKYFNDAQAEAYARQPEKIANRVYADRMGNGPESSGDGWRFRGRGALQLTGRDNYQEFANYINRPEIMQNPNLVATEYAFESAVFFFNKNKLWAMCDHGVNDAAILAITKRINGGTLGLDDRKEKTKKYAAWLSTPTSTPTAPKIQNNGDKLSEHFYLKDFIKSETATRKRIDNTPTATHLAALKAVCENILEPVYEYYKKPIRINSAYRGPALNKAVGGSSKSQHCNGEAVDFEIDGLPNPELANWIAVSVEFDQLILEFYNPKEGGNSGWVHCSYTATGNNRRQILTAVTVNGKTVYKPGFVL